MDSFKLFASFSEIHQPSDEMKYIQVLNLQLNEEKILNENPQRDVSGAQGGYYICSN
jgi:hypothetical protein